MNLLQIKKEKIYHFGDHDSEMILTAQTLASKESLLGNGRATRNECGGNSQPVASNHSRFLGQLKEMAGSTQLHAIIYNIIYTNIWYFMKVHDVFMIFERYLLRCSADNFGLFIHSLSLSRWWLEGNKGKMLGCQKSPSTVGNSTNEVLPFQDAQGRSQVPKSTIFWCEISERPVTFNPKYVVF